MKKKELEELFKIWETKEDKASLLKKRRYFHFDRWISFAKSKKSLKSFLRNTENINSHSFYPFIHTTIITPRYKKTIIKDKNGNEKSERRLIPKPRNIAYAAHFDSYIYSWYSTILTSKYEELIKYYNIEENVLAYLEKGKSNIDFAYEAFTYIKEKGDCLVLAFDVKGFFDSLDHELLKKMWLKTIKVEGKLPEHHYKVFTSITKFSYVDQADLIKCFPGFYETIKKNKKIKDKSKRTRLDRICSPKEFREVIREKGIIKVNQFRSTIFGSDRYGEMCGIPQGSPISACLSNIYMLEFDIELKALINKVKGMYYRYSDDILLIIDKEHEAYITSEFKKIAFKNYLEMGEDKTERRYFTISIDDKLEVVDENGRVKPLQYLGFEFDGSNIYIRSSSFSKYYRRLSARIRENLKAAHSNKSIVKSIFTKTLFNRYSEKGKRNFISYAKRAGETMDSKTIRKQSKNSINRVKKRMKKKVQLYEEKLKRKSK